MESNSHVVDLANDLRRRGPQGEGKRLPSKLKLIETTGIDPYILVSS